MGKTGGGIGTNQHAVKCVSQASRQIQSVVDDLAMAEEPDPSVPDEAEVRRFVTQFPSLPAAITAITNAWEEARVDAIYMAIDGFATSDEIYEVFVAGRDMAEYAAARHEGADHQTALQG